MVRFKLFLLRVLFNLTERLKESLPTDLRSQLYILQLLRDRKRLNELAGTDGEKKTPDRSVDNLYPSRAESIAPTVLNREVDLSGRKELK